jgi:hypothetical protein
MPVKLFGSSSSVVAGLVTVALVACAGNAGTANESAARGSGGAGDVVMAGASSVVMAGASSVAMAGASSVAMAGASNGGGGASAGASNNDLPCEIQSFLAGK